MFETKRTNCDPVRSCSDLPGMPCVNSSTSGTEPLRGPELALRGRKMSNGNTAKGMRLKQRTSNAVAPVAKGPSSYFVHVHLCKYLNLM